MMQAKDLMRPNVATVHVDQPISEAQARFKESRGDTLVVLDGDRIVGTIGREKAMNANTDEKIAQHMASKLRTCRLDDDINVVHQMLELSDASIIIVVDKEDQLQGIIRPSDIKRSERWPEAVPTPKMEREGPENDVYGAGKQRHRPKVYTEQPHVERPTSEDAGTKNRARNEDPAPLPIWRLTPSAAADDPSWLDHKPFSAVIVAAESPAQARVIAAEKDYGAQHGGVGNESAGAHSRFLDAKLYRVDPMPKEDVQARNYRLFAPAVIEFNR